MKRLAFLCAMLLSAGSIRAQGLVPKPIPCFEPKVYTPAYEPETSPKIDLYSYKCIDIFGPETPAPNTINRGRTDVVAGEYIDINPGTDIGIMADPYAPAYQPHYFDARIGEREFDMAWYEPNSTPGSVGRFEKLELGVKLPYPLDSMVYYFLHPTVGAPMDSLNPFDPADISVEATFSYLGSTSNQYTPEVSKTVYGFYYKEYIRNITTGPHPMAQVADTANNWINDTTSFPFRIRFAPFAMGKWMAKVKIVSSAGTFECLPVTFDCTASDNPGFVKVGSNARYLQLGDESFIPIGPVLAHPTCWDCWNLDAPGDEAYYYKPTNSQVYPKYHDELEDLASKGGNFFRMLLTPWALDIEWEKLNDYSNRLNYAWEMDRILDKAKELDLRMNLNMQIHYSLEVPSQFGNFYWDWEDDAFNRYDPSNTAFSPAEHSDQTLRDNGNAYQRELGLSEVKEFFTDADARRIYKNKVRYMISRWGYSTNIAIWELFSETDNSGAIIPKVAIPGNIYTPDDSNAHRPYWQDTLFRIAVEDWNAEIAGYIKEDLGHTSQLIAVDYTGGAEPDAGEGNNNEIWGADRYDGSYADPNIDIMAYNLYKGKSPNRYTPLVEQVDERCLANFKPLMFSEIGAGTDLCDNNSEFLRDLWSTAFSGAAGPGLDYRGESHDVRSNWHHYQILKDFLAGNDFATEIWAPYYNLMGDSDWGDDDEDWHDAEVFALIKGDGTEVWGAIVNTHYNFWTVSNGDSGSVCVNAVNDPGVPFNATKDVSSPFFHPLKIGGMDAGDYIILYYNALDGDFLSVGSGTVLPVINKLTMDYPTLTMSGSAPNPIVAFKAVKSSSKSLKLPQLDSILATNATVSIDFGVHPNPAADEMIITIPTNSLTGKIEVRNASGQVIYRSIVSENQLKISVSSWPSGLYFVTLNQDGTVLSKKLVVQNE